MHSQIEMPYLYRHFVLGKGTTPEKLVNTMNRQKPSDVGTQVACNRDPNCMSCDNLIGKDSINTHGHNKYNTNLWVVE